MNSDEIKEITQQLADVTLPPAPDWQSVIITATVIAVAIVIAIAIIYLRSRRKHSGNISDPSRTALYQLQQLEQHWHEKQINDHDAAYQLATLLRLGLELNQLSDTAPPALQDQQPQWQALQQQLAQLRYSPAEHSTTLTRDAFTQVATWLKQAHS